MQIRLMHAEDYDGVYRLWSDTVEEALRSLDDSREGIAKYLRRNPTTSFVAEENGRIVGAVLCGHDGRRGFIYHLAVALRSQGRGIGKALTAAALEALKAEGIHKAALVVFGANRAGNDYWENVGFTARGDLVYRNRTLNEDNR